MIPEEKLAELQAKNKRVEVVTGKDGAWTCAFRAPNRAEYKQFRSMVNNPNTVADAMERLARAVIVYPSREDFDALLEEYPAICEACGSALAALAGFGVEESVK